MWAFGCGGSLNERIRKNRRIGLGLMQLKKKAAKGILWTRREGVNAMRTM